MVNNWSKSMNFDAAKATGFNDSICNCASCGHKVVSECMKVRCSCCREINHSMAFSVQESTEITIP